MTTTITYDDKTVRRFMNASIFWGIVGMLVGLLAATQLSWWQMNGKFLETITFGLFKGEGLAYITFGRIRPLHTNAVIFAFVGNMVFAGVYYSTQRLCKCRTASDLLSAIISDNSEPEAVARARNFIAKNLEEPLPLALVARHAGLSESHFCRVFKEATGLTLTDYVNRRRIEWAKKELLKPEVRVSEIAFQIGYQSLSQFNRSFSRFTGNSPSNFRREELARATPVGAWK